MRSLLTLLAASANAFSTFPKEHGGPQSPSTTCSAAADHFLRPGCDSKVASNTTSAGMAGGLLYVYDTTGPWKWYGRYGHGAWMPTPGRMV